ncbi:hypothetical protein L6164_031658 [Bauhinia variegata]|uniref:Uncharacterized protein n=1 Tax=Bauhinia variegata TaxID=167791 RepID=A0ACB9LGH0_BAUVA|nr:hypothetical protein L6164_031658 [Bauhinia variegata]
MTTLILSPLFKLLVSLHLLCYSGYSFAYEGEETTVQDSSMQPSCIPPYKGYESTCIYPRCKYLSGYGDGTRIEGYYSQDRLALTSSDVIDNFVFGCSENNTGLFNEFEEDGIIGLAQHPLSIVYQTAKKHHKIFSYCLPSKTEVGFLRFGVNGKRLPIPSSLFAKAGAIIDSGTTTSRLPPEIYKPFRDRYRKAMSKYKFVDPKYVDSDYDIFDTCHSLGHQKAFKIPRISFLFSGGVSVDIPVSSITYNSTIACFAFSGKPFTGVAFNIIWGEYQQRTLEVEYDLGKGRLGFGYGACK